jgi:membrane protease subunit (stomatin/prohibitin family)
MIEQVYSQDIDSKGLAEVLEQTFRADGYQVQELGNSNDLAVQIRKESTGRAIVGMQQALTVRIKKEPSLTRVSLGQAKWADKAGVEVIGALVFWPLMVPATYGVYKQHTLPKRVIDVVNTYAASKGATNPESKTSSVVACSNCGVANSSDAKFCSACGSSLEAEKVQATT